jgi:hypothetical protein
MSKTGTGGGSVQYTGFIEAVLGERMNKNKRLQSLWQNILGPWFGQSGWTITGRRQLDKHEAERYAMVRRFYDKEHGLMIGIAAAAELKMMEGVPLVKAVDQALTDYFVKNPRTFRDWKEWAHLTGTTYPRSSNRSSRRSSGRGGGGGGGGSPRSWLRRTRRG